MGYIYYHYFILKEPTFIVSQEKLDLAIDVVSIILAHNAKEIAQNVIDDILIRGDEKALEKVLFRDSDYPEFYGEQEQNPHLDSLTISKQSPWTDDNERNFNKLIQGRKCKIFFNNKEGFKSKFSYKRYDKLVVFSNSASDEVGSEYVEYIKKEINNSDCICCPHCKINISEWFYNLIAPHLLAKQENENSLFDKIEISPFFYCPCNQRRITVKNLNRIGNYFNDEIKIIFSTFAIQFPRFRHFKNASSWSLVKTVFENIIGIELIEITNRWRI